MKTLSKILATVLVFISSRALAQTPTYEQVRPLFAKHCLSCHDAKQAEGKFVLDTYANLMKGGEDGPAITPGNASKSPLVQQIEHAEKPYMPPPKKAAKLAPDEIALIRKWIDAGAKGPAGPDVAIARALPKVQPTTAPRRAVHAMAYDAKSKLLAVAMLNEIELRSAETQAVLAKLGPHTGHVNALAFTDGGAKLIAAAGEPGVAGEVTIWNVADAKQIKRFAGHTDAIYALAVSADGKTLATGSYDQKIILWDADGKPLRELTGHNGAVFDLAFRPDGKVLASASADRTVKLWDVATGKRLDTRSEPTKDQNTLAFSPDGARLYAGGADNRVRIWKVSPTAVEGTNSLALSQFAHEGSLLRLVLSPDGKTLLTSADDKTVKLWDAEKIEPKRALESQPDWPAAIAFALDAKVAAVGRLDGTVAFYDAATGAKLAPPKPELAILEPRGLQRGKSVKVKLTGKDIATATALTAPANGKVTATMLPADRASTGVAWAQVTAAPDAPLGAIDLVATGPGGSSLAAKFVIDDLPQIEEREPSASTAMPTPTPTPSGSDSSPPHAATLPVTFGGSFSARGDVDRFTFDGKKGQTIVIDCAAKRFASKADPVVTLLDSAGRPLATAADDLGDADPLLVQTLPADGRYTLRVNDLQGATGPTHFYRMSVGPFAYVTGCFPLAVPPDRESTVKLIGYNLPTDPTVKVKAPATGEVTLPLDPSAYRTRRAISVLVGYSGEQLEQEPNDTVAQAQSITTPGAVSGTFSRDPKGSANGDTDCYRFTAHAGEKLVIETQAAQRFSPADTRIQILWPDGRPVERVQLRAVRDSWINFRAIDANNVGARLEHWEEMELNQFCYLQGEVVRLHLYPRGPDSEFNFYAIGGKRRCYFDTSAAAHALEEKCFIVEPHPPGEVLPENGLPVFKLNYANDDDQLRQVGADSRLLFTAPKSGSYVVRVTDTRNFGGPRFTYRLVVRPAKPDFAVTVVGLNPAVPAGSGRNFIVRADRIDGFDGPIKVTFSGVPAPFVISSPLEIQAGLTDAQGSIFVPPTAATTQPTTATAAPVKVTASATIEGSEVLKPLMDLPKLTVAGKPMMTVTLSPTDPGASEIVVRPGQRVTATLRVKRIDLKGPVTFEVEDLPHGVIVADIGLNGVLIPDGQEERQIFLKCAPWVAAQTRPCHARALQGDNPTSPPVMLRVAPTSDAPAAAAIADK